MRSAEPRTSQSRDARSAPHSCLGRSQQGSSKRGFCLDSGWAATSDARHSPATWAPSSTLSAPPTSRSSAARPGSPQLPWAQPTRQRETRFLLGFRMGRDLRMLDTRPLPGPSRTLSQRPPSHRAARLATAALGAPTRQRETTLASGMRQTPDAGMYDTRPRPERRRSVPHGHRLPVPAMLGQDPTQLPWAQPTRQLSTTHRVGLRMGGQPDRQPATLEHLDALSTPRTSPS